MTTAKNVDINVHHVTRIEGHGNIRVSVRGGKVERVEMNVVESPRFFEAFLRGRRYYEAPHITCRICGICAVGHTTSSVKAIEDACGITISEQSKLLRKLIFYGEQIQSHVLHVCFLVVPDFFGVGSVIPLASTHPDAVRLALRLKRLGNDICEVVGGRHIHPIAIAVGGVTHFPKHEELLGLKRKLEASRGDLKVLADLCATLKIPDFRRETEYVGLTDKEEYAFYDGMLASTKQPEPIPPQRYREWIHETVVDHSTAKHVRTPKSPAYMVGALARFNLNHDQLHPEAKKVAGALGLKAPCYNTFMNNVAQVVETVHCAEKAIEVIDELLTRGVKEEPLVPPSRFGLGAHASEVPRGILFHEYELDKKGTIVGSNLIIPTTQNYANMEADMRALVPQILDRSVGEMTLALEMLVRAYDPCISCSVHLIRL
ncbi:MAG: Ni/Fe hydrogenase subunit alpha [Planctomycetota bacterium]|nr:Ni/Fe hydrogenase subunit alpha [Planctomycetota bacterium]